MSKVLAHNWWMLVARGVFAIVFGIIALFLPKLTLTVLVLLFGAYALLDGSLSIVVAVRDRRQQQRWWGGLVAGLIGVCVGLFTFALPRLTGFALLYIIAVWAIFTGVLQIVMANQLRKELTSEWLMGLGGVLSVLFGVLLALSPVNGALAVVGMIGVYAIGFGIILVVLGVRLLGHQSPRSNPHHHPATEV